MKVSKKLLCNLIIIFFSSITMHADDAENKLKDTIDSFTEGAKSAWDGATNMLKGMGQGFGIVTSDYHYSYKVFNDAAAPIFVAEERLTGLLGATFQGEIKEGGGLTIGPNGNSGETFYNRQLYISVWICADSNEASIKKYAKSSQEWAGWGAAAGAVAGMGVASPLTAALGAALGALAGSIATVEALKKYKLYEKDIYPWPNNDDNVYFYRAYTYKKALQAEYLDFKKTTSEFSGQFYNNSKQSVTLTFLKDTVNYTVTLEPDTFSLLESSQQLNSIRSAEGTTRGFQFYKGTVSDKNSIAFIPLASQGIGNVMNVSSDPNKPQYEVAGPMLYTYEIYESGSDLEVGVQGLSIGKFDQPVNGKIRDINPVQCHLWYKSAAQVKAAAAQKKDQQPDDYTAEPFDVPETVWITYKTKDYSYQQKIKAGDVLNFTLLRPQVSEKEARFYVVSLNTDDDKKAQQFLDRLNAGTIGKNALTTNIQLLDQKTFADLQTNQNGIINDNQGQGNSGVIGTLLLVDTFTPQGVGDGPFYYIIEPSLLRIDQFANAIWFDTTFYTQDANGALALKPEVMKELATNLPQWILQYQQDQNGAKNALKSYLQVKANTGLFIDGIKPPQNREFTAQGNELYKTLINGPISIVNYPIMKKAGTNYYVFALGEKPEDWPEGK